MIASICSAALLASGCGNSDGAAGSAGPTPTDATVTAIAAVTAVAEGTAPTVGPAPTVTPAANPPPIADPTANPTADSIGEWPNRFCVDPEKVETTLNLRTEPSTESSVVASIPRASCELIANGVAVENGFQPVLYTTTDGALGGWVSQDFVVFQDPPDRLEAAALLFVDAWQHGLDIAQYSYGVGALPAPITAGRPVLAAGDEGAGCELVGDVTVECAIDLVEDDGTVVARLTVTGSQRGANGYDGEPYFEPDFPDGPTITGFAVDS